MCRNASTLLAEELDKSAFLTIVIVLVEQYIIDSIILKPRHFQLYYILPESGVW